MSPSRIIIVDAKNLMAASKKSLTKMGSEESRASRDEHTYSGKAHLHTSICVAKAKWAVRAAIANTDAVAGSSE